jgi:phosphatidylserine decarboxylase
MARHAEPGADGSRPPAATETPRSATAERLFVALQHLLPQHPLSRIMHGLAGLRAGPLTRFGIRIYARAYGVDLGDAAEPDLARYASFNAFFTRALRPGARPLEPRADALLCPVDGTISQIGRLSEGQMLQAKGHELGVADLLGGDRSLAARFADGAYATLYLSPRDYHRIHMPIDGTLTGAVHVPGRLFSVNAVTAARVPRLYARNERLVCLFDTAVGPLAVILVGAIFVGSIETVWHGEVTPPRGRRLRNLPTRQPAPTLPRGAELGRFNLGSTVILLLPRDAIAWRAELAPGSQVRVGEALGRLGSAD